MTSRSLLGDPIERFLADAERAARRGERDLALDLIVLALDTAPSDPAVLVRAHAIRAMLPAADAPPDAPVVGPKAPARIELPPPPRFDPVVAPPTVGGGDMFTLPDVGHMRLDSDEVDEDIAALLGIERTQPDPVPDLGPGSIRRPRKRGVLVYLLWTLLAAGLLSALVISAHPAAIDGITAAIRRTYDPFARAEHLSRSGRHQAAADLIRSHMGEFAPDQQVPARLLLAEAVLAIGDTTHAREELGRALARDTGWRNAMEAAQLFERANALPEAAGAYLLAFERGAPQERWEEIAAGQEAAGRIDQALHIRQLLERESGVQPAPTDPDTTTPDPAFPDSSPSSPTL